MRNSICRCVAAVVLAGTLTLSSQGCGARMHNRGQTDTCFIYTDGLLDDLCAIEYLSERYDNAILLLQDPEGLSDNSYASDTVTDERSLLDVTSEWFKEVTPYSDSADISETDLYLLAPLTEFAGLLEEDPSLRSKRALLMAGDLDGPDGAGEEWNATADIDAYRYVTDNMTDLTQVPRPDCESEYEKNGYPFDAQYLSEYISQMKTLDENVCCYDLQAVALAFK